jgi:Na+-translocating ferredoxin:NAD+ oxidoreductase RnfC subunit
VQYDDDAFFFLPKAAEREFLAFLRPGFDRTSFSPCFASRITGAYDTHISTSLRGEHRPCISCGRCEEVCPARLMPQILHRLLYREAIDEAQAAGLPACVECGLCTYVCPSKIDMQKQFADAKAEILREQSESEAKAQ